MIRWPHLLFALLAGIVIGFFISSEKDSPPINPQIQRLKAEIKWREIKENKFKDSLKIERSQKILIAKENNGLRINAQQSEKRYKEARKAIPLTRRDTIKFLAQDTTLCDSALLASKELSIGLTREIDNDHLIIKSLDSLSNDLQADKKDLLKVDSLHQQNEKQLVKKGKRKFLKGLGIGTVMGVILALLI